MASCKTCRHSVPVTSSDAQKLLTAATMGSEALSILEHPSFAVLRGVTEWRLCKGRMAVVPSSTVCGYHSVPLAGLFATAARDAKTYEKMRAEMSAVRDTEIRAAKEATRLAEEAVKTKPCESCGFLHARCADCEMPWPYCGKCVRCGGGVRYVRSLGGWECSLCEGAAEKPAARCEWPKGRCDSCRAIREAREVQDGSAADRPVGS